MKPLLLCVMALMFVLALAACRSIEHSYQPTDAAQAEALVPPPRPKPSPASGTVKPTPHATVADDGRLIFDFTSRHLKTPEGRDAALHLAIRNRLQEVQTFLEQRQPREAQQHLAKMKTLPEALRYYGKDIALLDEEIGRQMLLTQAVSERKLAELQAVREVEERMLLPRSYGTTRVIDPKLKPIAEPAGRMEQQLLSKVSLNLTQASLPVIIERLREDADLNIVADDALDTGATLTIRATNVPLQELLSYISRNMGVAFHLGDNIIWVTAAQTPDDAGPKLETRVYSLRKGYIPAGSSAGGGAGGGSGFGRVGAAGGGLGGAAGGGGGGGAAGGSAGADELLDALSDFLDDSPYNPPNTKFQIYRNQNLLVVRNTLANLRLAEAIIHEFDAVPKQVLIEARFVTISQQDLSQLGASIQNVQYNGGERFVATGRTGLPGFTNSLADNQLQVSGIIDNFTYSVVIEALKRLSSSRTLSSPRVTVLNNQPAQIRRGKTVYYFDEFEVEQTTTDNVIQERLVPTGDAQELQLGISLATTPSIGNDGKSVILSIAAEIAGPAAEFVTRNEVSLPEYPENTLTTTAAVNSGETVILGGMITNEESTVVNKVPFLGDIPLLGYLFRNKEVNYNPEHLLIFLTATIVDQDGQFNRVIDATDDEIQP